MSIDYHLSADVKVLGDLAGFHTSLREALKGEVRSAAWQGATLAAQYAPVRTGALAQSIGYSIDPGSGLSASWGPKGQGVKAVVMEHGSKPHIIRAKNAKTLAFFWPRPKGPGKMVYPVQVNHPGTKPYHYVKKSADAVERSFRNAVDRIVRTELHRRSI